MKLVNRVMTFVKSDEAQDLIEYALLVGLISLVAVVALGLTGTSVNNIFTAIQGKLASAT
jgi:Flp pilus assembly pilin Flp